jgi:hypothetical protein
MNRHPHWVASATLLVALAAGVALLAMGEPTYATDISFTTTTVPLEIAR